MSALLADAGVDAHNIDESFLWVEQRDDCICLSGGFKEKNETPFSRWTVGYLGDPTTILAHGCAFQAATEEIFTTLFTKLSHFHQYLFIKYISHLLVFHFVVIIFSKQVSRGDASSSSGPSGNRQRENYVANPWNTK